MPLFDQERFHGIKVEFYDYKEKTTIRRNDVSSVHDTDDVMESVCTAVMLKLRDNHQTTCVKCTKPNCIVNYPTKIPND